jgi:phage shock protein PspC (stress-responsive transcriptional regulator)
MKPLIKLLAGVATLTGLGVVALYVILDTIARAEDNEYFWE